MSDGDLVGRLPDPPRPQSMYEPVSPDDDPALARRNIRLAVMLWSVAVLLFAGTFLVAWAYLLLD